MGKINKGWGAKCDGCGTDLDASIRGNKDACRTKGQLDKLLQVMGWLTPTGDKVTICSYACLAVWWDRHKEYVERYDRAHPPDPARMAEPSYVRARQQDADDYAALTARVEGMLRVGSITGKPTEQKAEDGRAD